MKSKVDNMKAPRKARFKSIRKGLKKIYKSRITRFIVIPVIITTVGASFAYAGFSVGDPNVLGIKCPKCDVVLEFHHTTVSKWDPQPFRLFCRKCGRVIFSHPEMDRLIRLKTFKDIRPDKGLTSNNVKRFFKGKKISGNKVPKPSMHVSYPLSAKPKPRGWCKIHHNRDSFIPPSLIERLKKEKEKL